MMPPPIVAEIVVIVSLTAIVRAVPVWSVVAVGGSSVPAPMPNATDTFGTPVPFADRTIAATSSRPSAREPAVNAMCVGTVDAPGLNDGVVGTGGSYASHAGSNPQHNNTISARRL